MLFKSLKRENFDNILANERDFIRYSFSKLCTNISDCTLFYPFRLQMCMSKIWTLTHIFICARLMQFIQDIGPTQDYSGEKVMIAGDGKIKRRRISCKI